MPPRPPPTQRRAGSPTNARQPIVGSQPLEQDMMSASETSQPHDAPNVPPEQPFEPRDQDVDMDDPDSDRHEDVDDPPSSFEYRQKAPFTQRGSLPEDPIESEGDDQNDSDDSNDDNRPVDPTQPATQFPSPPLEPWMEDNVKRGRSMRPPHVESQAGPSSKPGGAARAKRAHSDDSQEGSSTRPGRSTKVPPALNQQQADYQPQDLRVGSKPAKKVAKRPFVFLKERRGGR
ncbi:hypothetical protein BDZ97DRAFT_771072 [Flammula alnicola]|nr:hypothetical protein BDZ97DRAFT_771072 [Flammula alnicola]